MLYNQHFGLEGRHARLSPSQSSWVNYDDDKMDRIFFAQLEAARGTRIHDIAAKLIREGITLEKNTKTLNWYVNDAIGFKMNAEQPLKYSENCFGTADALIFREMVLRIHDLKTGVTQTNVRQLEVYAALFCLEYGFRPFEIAIEMRIYQNDERRIYEADPDVIFHIMDKIITFDKRIEELKKEASL